MTRAQAFAYWSSRVTVVLLFVCLGLEHRRLDGRTTDLLNQIHGLQAEVGNESGGTGGRARKLGSSTPWGGDLGGSLNAAQYVQSISGNGGGNGTVTMNSNTYKVVTSPLTIQDNGAVQRVQFEAAHGRGTFGGGGSDYLGVIGPQAANETTGAAIYLLPNGTSPSGTNYSLASTSTDTYVQATAAGTLHLRLQSSGDVVQFNSTSMLSQVGLIQFGTGLSTGTLGTNKAGAGFNLQSDAAITGLSLSHRLTNSGVTDFMDAAGTSQLYAQINAVAGVAAFITPNNFEIELETNAGVGLTLGGTNNAYLAPSGLHQFTGGVTNTTRSITANLTVDTTTTDYEIWADTTSAAITVTLPTPTNGRTLLLIDWKMQFGTHNLTLAPHGSEKIDNVAGNKVISSTGYRGFITSNGVDWVTK